MKARVIETCEIVNVSYYGCPTYAVFDCNNRIKELYDADELEFEPTQNNHYFVFLNTL